MLSQCSSLDSLETLKTFLIQKYGRSRGQRVAIAPKVLPMIAEYHSRTLPCLGHANTVLRSPLALVSVQLSLRDTAGGCLGQFPGKRSSFPISLLLQWCGRRCVFLDRAAHVVSRVCTPLPRTVRVICTSFGPSTICH